MKKVNYYTINYSVNPKVIGKLSSSEDCQINGFTDSENNSVERTDQYQYIGFDFIDTKNLDMHKFKVEDNAILTDLMNSRYFNGQGFFISERFKHILDDYHSVNIQLLNATVFYNTKPHNLFFIDFIGTSNVIHFSKSKFIAAKRAVSLRFSEDNIAINSYDDYMEKGKQLRKDKGFSYAVIPKILVLKNEVDLIQLSFTKEKYVSQKLKNKLEEQQLTGIEFKETDMEFYIED